VTQLRDATAGRLTMYSRSGLKLGIFGPNCSSGLAATKVPERWSGSWRDNLRLAQMLDDAGIEFILPVGRWKGYGGETDPESDTFETVTWATGLLAATRRITVFGTVHAPLIHPVYGAKMFVTADHAGEGRFGLNVVCGWNQDEFDMFGAQQREHDERYAYGAEWLEIVTRLWTEEAPFDHDGQFFHLKGVQAHPKPYGGTRPLLMNAGASPAGKAFAIRHADDLFTRLYSLEGAVGDVRAIQTSAAAAGRNVSVFSAVNVVCRPTTREAEEYYRYYADEMADWAAIDNKTGTARKHGFQSAQYDAYHADRVRQAAGYGGYPCVGDPDAVAGELAKISAVGFAGLALGLVNYLDEFPYFRDEVLPRLERLGLREPVAANGA
jgi:alkanesulfonate monooxygenase SsuD/methylene tetrahydromethanopterin reductase-like flavin-dependent oxidoreductase (luciferase family)